MNGKILAAGAISVLVTIGGAGSGWATPVLEFTGGTVGLAGFNATAGWSFTTNQAVDLTALDAFDPKGTGAGGVRLYNAAGTVLASATITTNDCSRDPAGGYFDGFRLSHRHAPCESHQFAADAVVLGC